MSAPPDQAAFGCSATSLDDITTFLGTIPPEEYELRRRIRACRNTASFQVTQTENQHALWLYWIVTETSHATIYAPASLERLEHIAQFLRRLLIVANQAIDLEAGA